MITHSGVIIILMLGFGTGILSVAFMIGLVMICQRKHSRITNTNGYIITAVGNSIPIGESSIQTNNVYVDEQDSTMTRNVPGPSRPTHKYQRRRVSSCSEYTESHYYTEIDQYFINKRNEKQQKKLQKRYGSQPSLLDINASSSQLESSTHVYDYAYCKMPRQ